MYYVRQCSYCSKVFYTYNNNREEAARILYEGVKKHLGDYDEDHKEYVFDDTPKEEEKQMYYEMREMKDPPRGGYEL